MTEISDADLQGLRRLLDESAIRALIARYSHAIDRLDWDELRSCYHDDAVDLHGDDFAGGIDTYIEWLHEHLPVANDATMHFTGTQSIEVDGDVAWAETYCLALHRLSATADAPTRDAVRPVRYVDRLERRHGEWRIARRTCIYEPGRIDGLAEPLPPSGGARDRSDPSYARD